MFYTFNKHFEMYARQCPNINRLFHALGWDRVYMCTLNVNIWLEVFVANFVYRNVSFPM